MACANTVAVVVPSPATSDVLLATSRTICAPIFSSGSFNSISLATVTPSFVIVGDPNFLSRMTLRALVPTVPLTACDGGALLRSLAFDDGQHVILFHDEVLLASQPDLLARILAKQDPVAHYDNEGDALAVVVHLALADCEDRALLRLLFGRVRNDDPA